jgi:hypothetical protein
MSVAKSIRQMGCAFVLSLACATAQETSPSAVAPAYNVTLITDSAPDFTDIKSYLQSITSQFETPQEKAIAVFRWSQRLRKQTSPPEEDGHEVLDPIFFFTNYGYTMCAIISGIDNSLWMNLGWRAHYVQLGDHTVCECSWDEGKTWHMFDNSTSVFCFNEKNEVASVREIEKNPLLYLRNVPAECGTNPVKDLKDHQGWRWGADHPVENQRTLANGVDSFLPPNEIHEDHLATRWGRRFVLNLRPGENYTRNFNNLDTAKSDPRYYRPLRGKDVDAKSKNIRANGVWHYAPDLRDPATRAQIYSDAGVSWTEEGVKGPGQVTFKVSAANVITSAKISLKGTGAKIAISRTAGIQWESISALEGEAEVLDQVAGGTEFHVKVELEGPAALLSDFTVDTITQINRSSMPRLSRGPNQVQLRLGRQLDTITLAPLIPGGNHSKTISDEKSIAVNAKPYFNVATLVPAVKNEAAYVTWKIQAPSPITDVVYGGNICVKRQYPSSATLLHSWDGKTFVEDFKDAEGGIPYDKVVNATVKEVPAEAHQVYLRYQFQTAGDPEKQWSSPGLQAALMTVLHEPRVKGFTPIEVTYCWIEHRESGDVERRHTQLVTTPAYQYAINVGGFRDPTMKWVRLNLKGHGPADAKVKIGYSDDQDVGATAKPARENYQWGKNVALGKSYKLEGKQDARNPDAGNDLTDGVIMPPDTYVSVKWMPTNVMFAKDVSPVATLDLGSKQSISAVRVSTGQDNSFRITYPDAIVVETSDDGQTYTRAGGADFNQVFDPPADYIYGECEGSSVFELLPAGGRLAYAYRVVFDKPIETRFVRVTSKCRSNWAVLLSEIQVFDKVKVDKNPAPAVVLPPIGEVK